MTAGYTYALVLFARVPGRVVAVAVASASLAAVGSVGITASATWARSWRAKSKQERQDAWRRLRAQIGQHLLRLVVLVGQLLWRLVVLIGQSLWWLVVEIGQRLRARIRGARHRQVHMQEQEHRREEHPRE